MNEYEKDKLRIQAVKNLQRIAEALERIAEAEEKRTKVMTEPITWENLERFEHG